MIIRGKTRRFLHEERGVSGLEFALVAPVMLVLLLGTFEVTRAFSAQRKVVSMATTVNRLVAGYAVLTPEQFANPDTNKPGVTAAQLNAVVNAATAVLFPLDASRNLLTVTIDRIDRVGTEGVIQWTYDWGQNTGTKDPDDKTADYVPTRNSVVRTRIAYTHQPLFTGLLSSIGIDGFTLNGTAIGGGEGEPTTTINGNF